MDIYPSILETNINIFAQRIQQYAPIFPHMQIDIADGVFVDNTTVQTDDLIRNASRFMLYASKNTFEFHLMVKDWKKHLDFLNSLKNYMTITRVFVHAQVFNSQFSLLPSDYEFGLALNPEDMISENLEMIKDAPAIQIMTVEPGRQGSPFLPAMVDKVDTLREAGYTGTITLDGAINDRTLPQILEHAHWPDAVCPGSYFHRSPAEKLEKLQEIVGEHKNL